MKTERHRSFAALSQATRLDTFRLLMNHEPEGLPAGKIARRLEVPQNTMSTHLAILARAGLIESERHSRSIIYWAVVHRVREITTFLVQDCCGGLNIVDVGCALTRPIHCGVTTGDKFPCR